MIHTRRELIEYIKHDAAAQPRKKYVRLFLEITHGNFNFL